MNEEIVLTTGRDPSENVESFAAMLNGMTSEKILTMLGTGSAELLARDLLGQIRASKADVKEHDEAQA